MDVPGIVADETRVSSGRKGRDSPTFAMHPAALKRIFRY